MLYQQPISWHADEDEEEESSDFDLHISQEITASPPPAPKKSKIIEVERWIDPKKKRKIEFK
jgi:hypothetical protein